MEVFLLTKIIFCYRVRETTHNLEGHMGPLGIFLICLAFVGIIGWLRLRHASSSASHQKVACMDVESDTITASPQTDDSHEEEHFKVITLGEEMVSFQCGHDGPALYRVSYFGQEREPTQRMLEERPVCPECQIEQMRTKVIQCSLCRGPIMPGDVIGVSAGIPEENFDRQTMRRSSTHSMYICGSCTPGAGVAGQWSGTEVYNQPSLMGFGG